MRTTSGNSTIDAHPYPKIPDRKLGPTEDNDVLKIAPKSHPSAQIKAPESGEFEITMATAVPCDLTCEFDVHTKGKIEGKENFTFISQNEEEATIQVRIPEAGTYHLKIYGLDNEHEDNIPLLYNYIVEASHPKENCLPFPETSPDWILGSKLLEPAIWILPANQVVTVAVKVPDAEQVVACLDPSQPFTPLEKSDDNV